LRIKARGALRGWLADANATDQAIWRLETSHSDEQIRSAGDTPVQVTVAGDGGINWDFS
jgi:hypothetical protein